MDFPDGPVVKTQHLHCKEHGFGPGWAKFRVLHGVAKKGGAGGRALSSVPSRIAIIVPHFVALGIPW